MEIEIIKKEDGEIIFKIDGEENKFEYEYFDKLIERVYENDEKINFNVTSPSYTALSFNALCFRITG